MSFLLDLWSDTAGKIFLITFASYLVAYLVYGGYIHAFFGKNVGLPFGLVDFSVADLISIFPAVVITLFNVVPKAFVKFLKSFVLQVVMPFLFGLLIRNFLGFNLAQFAFDIAVMKRLAQLGAIIWILGITVILFQPRKVVRLASFVLEYFGAFLFFASLPNLSETFPTTPAAPNATGQVLDDVLVLTLVLESIVAIPYLFGAQITKTAIELDLLIRIERLTLRQPIFREGLRKVAGFSEAGHKTPLRRSWLVQENLPVDVAPGVYEWSLAPEKGIYLIATFEKFVLLFVRELSLEDSYTVMINRADILSMEIGQVIRPEAK